MSHAQIFLSYAKVDMEYAFKRGWVYQETANTQLMPNRVQAFLHEHRGDRKILEAFFVRRGANLPLVMQKLREEKPMTEPELATIFAHLAYNGSHIEAMLQALTKVLARYCDESWFIEAIVTPTKHDCANPIQAFQLLNAYCSLDLTVQADAPQASAYSRALNARRRALRLSTRAPRRPRALAPADDAPRSRSHARRGQDGGREGPQDTRPAGGLPAEELACRRRVRHPVQLWPQALPHGNRSQVGREEARRGARLRRAGRAPRAARLVWDQDEGASERPGLRSAHLEEQDVHSPERQEEQPHEAE